MECLIQRKFRVLQPADYVRYTVGHSNISSLRRYRLYLVIEEKKSTMLVQSMRSLRSLTAYRNMQSDALGLYQKSDNVRWYSRVVLCRIQTPSLRRLWVRTALIYATLTTSDSQTDRPTNRPTGRQAGSMQPAPTAATTPQSQNIVPTTPKQPCN